MPLKFDAALKTLVREFPLDWAKALGMTPAGPVEVVTPDLSAVTAFADTVLHLGDRLLHVDFQSSPDPELPRRLMLYNVLLFDRYALPVHTVVVLLRPRADRGDLTNRVAYAAHPGRGKMEFEFEILRLWQTPVETLLTEGMDLLPLAILGQMPEGVPTQAAMSAVVQRIAQRAKGEAASLEKTVLSAAFLLSGMRVAIEVALELFQGVGRMEESTTYQYILNLGRAEGRGEWEMKGRVTEVRKILFRLGRIRFGEPAAAIVAAIEAIADLDHLERLTERLLLVTTWEELLAVP